MKEQLLGTVERSLMEKLNAAMAKICQRMEKEVNEPKYIHHRRYQESNEKCTGRN